MNLFDITGKVAVVTGANRSLGKQMALGFAQAGVRVAAIGRNMSKQTMEELESHGTLCKGYDFDLANFDEYPLLLEQILEDFDTVDILVNNAGVQKRHPSAVFPKQDWDFVMSINCDAVFFLCQLFGNVMLENKKGKIINMASMLSFQGGYTVPAYTASKSAIIGFTRALSNEWAHLGVNVNSIAPGYMDTDMNTALKADETRNQQILDRIPAGRWGTPHDIVGTALFLASPASDYINGYTIAVDGGWLGR